VAQEQEGEEAEEGEEGEKEEKEERKGEEKEEEEASEGCDLTPSLGPRPRDPVLELGATCKAGWSGWCLRPLISH
jgi:hypothetical protein